MRESVIVSATRLPTGKFLGSLKSLPAPELGALVVREAVARSGIEPGLVDECIMGNVVSAGTGQASAPTDISSATVWFTVLSVLLLMTTLTPSRARRTAMPLPIPRPDPVTTATLPRSSG